MNVPNFIVHMRRDQLKQLRNCSHAGLLLDKGFKTWAKKADNNYKQHNEAIQELHKDAAEITFPTLYKNAFKNWQKHQIANTEHSQIWFGKLVNRMYLGMGEASPLEAGITLHHTYGVPYIPGSAIKGVLHHYAHDIGLSDEIKAVLFGEEASVVEKQDSGASGYIIFNDAWWVPEGKALAPEMITVHAPKYYSSKGNNAPHPDFESPNPNPQIAIQGGFLFSIEGSPTWAEYAMKLLQQTLHEIGIGGKNASGYGVFEKEKTEEYKLEDQVEEDLNNLLTQVKGDHNIKDDAEAFASKPMAEEWTKVDGAKKEKLFKLLQEKWKENERSPSKKAQKIYDGNNQ